MALRERGKPVVTRPRRFHGQPLLSVPVRPLAVALLLACVAVVAVLGALTAHQSQAGPVDARIDAAITAALGSHVRAIQLTVDLGEPLTVTAICAVLVLACLAARRPRGALLVAVAVPLAAVLTEFALKPLFGRTLGGGLSFPSGHETGVSAMAAAFIVLLAGPFRALLPAALRWLLAALTVCVMAAEAPALVAIHYHYFSDTIGGAATGAGTVILTALMLDGLSARLARSRARAGSGAGDPETAGARGVAADGMTTGARRLPPA